MSEETEQYDFNVEDYNFMRGFVHEFIIVQILSEIARSGRSAEEASSYLAGLRKHAYDFADFLSKDGTSRDIAWRTEMRKTFDLIYKGAAPMSLGDNAPS